MRDTFQNFASANEPKKINVLAIGYGRNLFVREDAERGRMRACAQEVQSYHMIIFTRQRDNLSVVTEKGLTLYPTNSRFKLLMLWDAFWLGKKVVGNAAQPWVITAQDPFEAGLVGWMIARSKNLALNLQEHADYFSTSYWREDSWSNRIRYSLGVFLLKRADSVRVVSKRISTTLQTLGVSSERICTLPVRSDQVTELTDPIADSGSLRSKYPNALIVLTMARLVTQKNLSLLVTAFAELAAVKAEALLVIVGKGDQEAYLRNLVKKLRLHERVVFLPWTDSPGLLLKEADIYALTSNWEGWARVLIEAMAAGVPVVTTDVGCAGEVLLDGQHGFVVPIAHKEMFATRLIELAEDVEKRISFGEAAQVAVAGLYGSRETYAKDWAEVLLNTLRLRSK